jgi:hypothetical protein
VRWPLFGLLYQPRIMDNDECGEVGGMTGRGNRSIVAPILFGRCPHCKHKRMSLCYELTGSCACSPILGSQILACGSLLLNNQTQRRSSLIIILNCSQNMMRVINLLRIRFLRRIATIEMTVRRNLKGRDNLNDLGLDGRC